MKKISTLIIAAALLLAACGAPSGASYEFYVKDTAGNPVKDVSLQVSTDAICRLVSTDADGKAVFAGEPMEYSVKLLKLPEGYDFGSVKEQKTGKSGGTLSFELAIKERPSTESETAAPAAEETKSSEGLVFSTTDRDGNKIDQSIFSDHKLTMINFFEPWCPPCVGEMPDIEKLYNDYSEKGLNVIGVYSTEQGIEKVLEKTKVSYPILKSTADFDFLMTGFVPTTVFIDSDGKIVTHELTDTDMALLSRGISEELASMVYVGGNSYDGWAATVDSILGSDEAK